MQVVVVKDCALMPLPASGVCPGAQAPRNKACAISLTALGTHDLQELIVRARRAMYRHVLSDVQFQTLNILSKADHVRIRGR